MQEFYVMLLEKEMYQNIILQFVIENILQWFTHGNLTKTYGYIFFFTSCVFNRIRLLWMFLVMMSYMRPEVRQRGQHGGCRGPTVTISCVEKLNGIARNTESQTWTAV